MSIHDMLHKINRGVQGNQFAIIYISIVVIVGFCSFLLGRLSLSDVYTTRDEGITITNMRDAPEFSTTKIEPQSITSNTSEGKYLASKNGKLYYSVGCKAANRIKPENRVWFDLASDAEKLGYSPSSSCK